LKKVRYITHIERSGIEKGRADGLKIGIDRGRAEGHADFLIRLLEEKFGILDPDIQTTVYRLDENRLFEWVRRTLTAQTLREVIGQ
jgi:hypothetical protein